MHLRVPLFSLLLALFLFFRYLRANMNAAMLLASFVFMGVTIYEAKGNIAFTLIVIVLIITQIYVAFLKYKKHPRIITLQSGYKPSEAILHYLVFGILFSIVYFFAR